MCALCRQTAAPSHASHNTSDRAFNPRNELKCSVTPVLVSHNIAIASSADIYTPTHHLAVNAPTRYLILFIILFIICRYQRRRTSEEVGLVIPVTCEFRCVYPSSPPPSHPSSARDEFTAGPPIVVKINDTVSSIISA